MHQAEGLAELVRIRSQAGRRESQRDRHEPQHDQHRQAEAEQSPPPIERTPQRQKKERIPDQSRRQSHENAGNHGPAVRLDRPNQQRRRHDVIDARSEIGRVGQQQIQGRRGNARVGVVEMPIADQDHPQHDGEVGDDGRGALDRVVRFAGEDVKQGIARSPLLEDLDRIGSSRPWHAGLVACAAGRRPRASGSCRLGA